MGPAKLNRPARLSLAAILTAWLCLATPACAAGGLQGAQLSSLFALPFAGLLLSIALLPQLAAPFWHHHYGKVAAFWALALIVPLALAIGLAAAGQLMLHTLLAEYLPFIVLLTALFTLAGGIRIGGNAGGTPVSNTFLLALGAGLASLIGTTGAAMVLVRPLVRANAGRPHNAHVLVFFIFLAANIGGALTPLGDPPLFLGFLRGVDFFWTLRNLWQPTLFCVMVLLGLFLAVDSWHYRREKPARLPGQPQAVRLEGWINLPLIALAIALIIGCAFWRGGVEVEVFGLAVPLRNLVRDFGLLLVTLASLLLTRRNIREANGFEWEPMLEVAKLFAAIFVCIIPVLALLAAGKAGPFAPLLDLVTRPDGSPLNPAYFWATGLLSSFLDNAPTYLVFFEMAGGDPVQLTGPLASTLAAVSLGAVFMGANSYIGNAPNFMVYAIARRGGINMPGFFGYMLWSGAILLPLFAAVNGLFVR